MHGYKEVTPDKVEICLCFLQSASVTTRVSSIPRVPSGRMAVPMTVNVPTLLSDSTSATTSQSLESYCMIHVTYDCECSNAAIGLTVNVPILPSDGTRATSQSLHYSHPRIQFTYDCECTNAAIGQYQCYNKSVIR